MPYLTECPNCGGGLFVTKCIVYTNAPIHSNGFDLSEAAISTENETVACNNCDYEGPLQFVERTASTGR